MTITSYWFLMAEVLQFQDEKTDKETLEQRLRKCGIKYRDLFENASDAIYIYDPEGYFMEVNNTALKLLGCEKEEIIGTHVSKWITPESLKLTRENLKKCIAGETVNQPMVLEVVCKSGEHKLMEIRRRLIRDGDKVIAVHGIGRDITEKRRMEVQLREYHEKLEKSYEKLRESEEMYRNLFENANDAIFTCDAEGHIITANNAAVIISGLNTKDEVINTHFSDWLTPESLRQALNNTKKYFSGENVKQPVVYEFIQKNGEHRWVEIRSQILKEGDKAIALQCIARDITEKRKLEQELKESEAKYRELFENAQDIMYVLDIEGNFLNVNWAGLQTLGCAKDEVISSNISKWLAPESLKIAQERLKKRLLGDIVDQKDIIEFVCKSGEHRWAEVKSRLIRDSHRPIEIHGISLALLKIIWISSLS